MKTALAALALLALAACGGGAYDLTIKTQESATEEDVLKCGIGAYYVAPSASSAGKGYCVAYEQVPAASAPGR